MPLFLKILKWGGISIGVGFAALVVGRMFYLRSAEKTAEQVAKIHATKLTLDDVMGKNLPPPPGDLADKTVQGIDANKNGIRDDVELAIFKEYPSSAKTRAVLLQYALALQMEVVQLIVNTETVIAVAQEKSRSSRCIADVVSRNDIHKFIETTQKYTTFVKKKQINNQTRDDAQKKFYEKLGSYSDLSSECDIDLKNLPN